MGSSSYDPDVTTARLLSHTKAGTDAFTHTAKAAATGDYKVHEKLDPKGKNKAGVVIRESRDSDLHPNSVGVAVVFDVTGSMSSVPRTFVEKLPKLMGSIVKNNFLTDPHVLFAAVGDATKGDRIPLQIGQFEAGNELDDALTLMILEGGGGGGLPEESYELAMYFLAHKVSMDCLEKRRKKGYLFILGDETPYPAVRKDQVKTIIGDSLQADIPTSEILAELRQKFEVFWIIPGGTSHFDDPSVLDPLRKLFGQNLLKLDNPGDICELIASTIGVTEGSSLDDVGTALKDVGMDDGAIARASSALAVYARNTSVVAAAVTGDLPGGTDSVTRT